MTQNKSKSAQRESKRDSEGSASVRLTANALACFQSCTPCSSQRPTPDEGHFLLKHTLCVFSQVQYISGDPRSPILSFPFLSIGLGHLRSGLTPSS